MKGHHEFLKSELFAAIQTALRRAARRGWHRWLVNDFLRRDLSAATPAELVALHPHICALAQTLSETDWRLSLEPLAREALIALQEAVRAGLEEQLAGRQWRVGQPRLTQMVVETDFKRGPKRWTTSYLARIDSVLVPSVLRFVDVDREPLPLDQRFLRRAAEEIMPYVAKQLRYCHWCAEIFEREGRRDLYCSEPCAQRDRDNRKLPKDRRAVAPYVDKLMRYESLSPRAKQ